MPDLHGYTALVTDANSGLGLETTRALVTKGAHVVMAIRDLEKGHKAQSDLERSLRTRAAVVAFRVGPTLQA
jgi:NAD(P)-dependent dehydrogenase (short-subunit alcohol dehydrogenase family)